MGPALILTSAFTAPSASASFGEFTGYITRAGALARSPDRTIKEDIELSLINSKIFAESQTNELVMASDGKGETAAEAKDLITKNRDELNRYLRYMTRARALVNESDLSEEQQDELRRLEKELDKTKSGDGLAKRYFGTFSETGHNLTERQVLDMQQAFNRGQANGSVLFEDVVSFNNDFLAKMGIYDPSINHLNEDTLVKAGRAMMTTMQDAEGLNNVQWMASFHRNTKHVHIHFASVEQINTRELVMIAPTKDGELEMIQPRGKRKQSTIDRMKSTFAGELVDRTREREMISELRNGLIKNIRTMLSEEREPTDKMLELYQRLPEKRSQWSYAYLHDDRKDLLDDIVKDLMQDDPKYDEYQRSVAKSHEIDVSLYGHSERESKNYEQNKQADLDRRLGNQVLKYLKNVDDGVKQSGATPQSQRPLSKEFLEDFAKGLDEEQQKTRREEQQRRIRRENQSREFEDHPADPELEGRIKQFKVKNAIRHDLNTLKKSMSNYTDPDKFRAMQEYERHSGLAI